MTAHNEPNPTTYVLGFAFSHTMKSVVLITKKKPAWQAGKLNGVGGKVERGEMPLDAMTREFTEETGFAYTRHADWHLIEIMRFHNGAVVYCYTTRLIEGAIVRTMEEEEVDAYPVDDVNGQLICEMEVINNLHWLIPKAYHQMKEPPIERMIVG